MNSEANGGERLQKVLAAAGVGSRRDCEQLIRDGRVEVARQVVTELGFRVDPEEHEIRVDGEVVRISRRVYYLVNKPQNVVCTNYDPDGRPRVVDLVPPHDHLFTVGRLDRSSEGLILVTNDGELANRLAHPRYEVSKTYRVEVAGHPTPEQLDQLLKGVHLAEGKARATSVNLQKRFKQSAQLEIVLREGRNREIRRMLAKLGHKVLRLKRVALGPLKLGEVKAGGFRKLDRLEVEALQHATTPAGKKGPAAGPGRRAASPKRKIKPKAKPPRPAGKVLTDDSGGFVKFQVEKPLADARAPKTRSSGGKRPAASTAGEKPARRFPTTSRKKKRPR